MDARGLHVYAPGKSASLRGVGEAGGPSTREHTGWPRRDVLAVPPSAKLAWVGTPGERSWSVPVARTGAASPLPWRFLDLVAIDDDRVFGALVGGTEKK